MRKPKPEIVLKEGKRTEYQFPAHLKTSWTSLDAERFKAVISVLRNAFSDNIINKDEPREYVVGSKEVLQYVEKHGMKILCVIACVDNGGDVGLLSRIVRNCFQNGIPIILGRGPRELGSAFGKNRVCTVALTKLAGSKSELFDLVMNLSSLASEVSGPLETPSEIVERFRSLIESKSITASEVVKRKAPTSIKKVEQPPSKKPKTPTSNQKKKPKDFFTSFD
jgi:ribosomal protein L7Ae-like RNA K-turn-binding protein